MMKHNGQFFFLMKLDLLSYKCFNRSLKLLITQSIYHLHLLRHRLLHHSPLPLRLRPPQLLPTTTALTDLLSPEIFRLAPLVDSNFSHLKNRLLVLVHDLLRLAKAFTGGGAAAGDELLAKTDVDVTVNILQIVV